MAKGGRMGSIAPKILRVMALLMAFSVLNACDTALPLAQSVRTLARGDDLDLSLIPNALQKQGVTARKSWTPEALVYADDGSLWVSDSHNHRILSVSPTGVIQVLTGDETAGNDNGSLDKARFDTPHGLHWDGQTLWVADTHNDSIRAVSPYDNRVQTAKIPAGELTKPLVVLRHAAYLWIAEASGKVWRWHTQNHKDMRLMMDLGPHRVIRQLALDTDGEHFLLLDNLGLWSMDPRQEQPVLIPDLAYRENLPRLGGFWPAKALVVTTPFETDPLKLRHNDRELLPLNIETSSLEPPLRYPGLITGNAQGDLVVADVGSQSLYRLIPIAADENGEGSQQYAASVLAQSGTQGFGERRDNEDLSLPHGLLYLPERKVLWVADYYHNRVLEINASGQARPLFENHEPALAFPTSLVRHPNGDIYISASGSHQIFVYRAGELTVFAGSGTRGLKNGSAEEAQFWLPWGMAFDAEGRLYVADHGNHAIRRISPAGEVTTLAGNGSPGFMNGKGERARFHHPVDLLFYDQQLLITDSWNHQLRALNLKNLQVTTYAGRNEPGLQEGSRTKARFYCPSGLSEGPNGSLLIADTWNHRIRQMSAQGQVSTLAGEGHHYNWNSGEQDGANARFQQPRDMVYDPVSQQVFVADTGNHSIRIITP
jgi:sugar lactone lactonase YvrE